MAFPTRQNKRLCRNGREYIHPSRQQSAERLDRIEICLSKLVICPLEFVVIFDVDHRMQESVADGGSRMRA